MIFTMPGVPASAVEAGVSAVHTGLCKHHPKHTEDCGYTEGTEGAACKHEHTEDCYTLVKKCIHKHDESCYTVLEGSVSENTATSSEVEETQPTECTHECSEESGCKTKKLSCPHEHDESCGYIPATEGTPCGYICEQCNSQDSGLVPGVSGNAPAECICETRCEKEAVNPDCPVCSAEDADLSACKGTEQVMSLMAAAASTETISGEVTWNNQTFTTPVKLTGDTTLTLEGDNKIECDAPLDLNNFGLTVKGTGTLTVVGNGRSDTYICNGAIFDSGYTGYQKGQGNLCLEGGTVTARGGDYNAISVRSVELRGGKLEAYGGSNAGIVCSYLYTYGGSLYATGDEYGIGMRTMNVGNPGNLAILASDEKDALMAEMDAGDIGDIKDNAKKKTYYIGEVTGPLFSVKTQKGTLYEGVADQKATFAISAKNVNTGTLKAQGVGDHYGLTESLSTDGKTLTVTTDATVKQGTYSLTVSVTGTDGTTVTKTVTVTVSGSPLTISTQPQDVSVSCKSGDLDAWQGDKEIRVTATLATGQTGDISYQWKLEDGTELEGFTRSTLSLKELYNAGKLSPVADKLWLFSAKVYCTLTYGSCSVNTNTVTLTVNTCPHEKYTHEGKCRQCGEPCREDVLFIDKDDLPYSSVLNGGEAMVGSKLISGGTFYFVRDIDAVLRAGGDEPNKKDLTLDLQGHEVKALDLQNCPYKSVTIKNGRINDFETQAPTVLILDSVTTDQAHFSTYFTLTVKGDCVFEHGMEFIGETQLQGGTFPWGINVEPGEQALALLADGYAFADTDSNEILNASDVRIQGRSVKVVAHTCQYQNGKCACGRICDHVGKVDKDGYCTFCHALVEAFETGGKRYTSLEDALAAAQDGDTITLRGPLDIENPEPIEISKNIILNLNGFTLSKSREEAPLRILGSNVAITNGKVQSTCVSKSANAVEVGKFDHTGAKLTLDNVTLEGSVGGGTGVRGFGLFILTGNEAVVTSGTFTGGIYTEGTLTMSGGSADLLKLGYNSGIRVILSGGSFDSIKIKKGADYQSLLAAGYAYQKQDGAWVKLSEMNANTAVTVVECSHPDDPSGGNVCPYCGYAAEVTKKDGSISYHRTADAAIAAADGGTVKLLANAGEITIGSPLKLNLNGKTAAKLTVTGDVTLASLLPEGYVFKSGSTWLSDPSGTELTNVSMAKIPIKSMNYPTEMSMTYGGAGTLLVNVKKETGTGAVSFQWYKVEDGKETAVGSATTKYQFDLSALKLPAGQHTFRFLATCDGYEKMSEDIAVTVQKADIRSGLITPPTAQETLTYTGQEQALITAGSVTSGGTMQYSLTENGTYSQDIPAGTDAGTYTVWYRVIGDANHNDTAPASVVVRIGKKPLTISGVTAVSKPYDGTTDAGITSVTFDGMNLNRGTDYTVTANFDDAGVGSGKNVTATVTLMGQTAKNYSLEQSSFTTTGSIIKAAAPDFVKETALTIVNGHEKTYTVTLPALPTLKTPKEYGALTYEIGEVKLNDGYYTSGAKVENGELTLPIQNNDVETTGSVGTVTVVIKSANYEDITLTVNVSAKNRITPTGTPTLSKNAIIYGDALNTIALSGKLHDNVNNVDVDGTFEWVDGTHIPVVGNGTYAAEWIFEPTDTEKYLTVSGRSNITVEKARQYGKLSMAGYTYGKTPSTPTLTDQTGDLNAQVTYSYAAADSGSVQTWDISNPPALNAGTYRMYASIGDTDNYYGFEVVYCEFVVAKATPTYTVPTGLTAKYGQTLADVTLPDGWSWMDSSESVGGASTAAKTFQAKFTPKDTENYNTVENIELEVTVNKADGGNLKTVELEQKYTDASDHTYTPDWAGLPAGQDWTFSSEASIVLPKQDFAADGNLLTYAISGGKAGDKITLILKASCDNYEDFTITLNVTLTEKDDQKPLTITGNTSVIYGEKLTLTTTGGSGMGAVTYRIDNAISAGEATIDPNTGVLTPVKVGSVSVIATKAGDNNYNDVTSAPFVLMIKPATPTGEPKYTKITTSGKTLKDVTLTIEGSTLNPSDGKLEWVDDKGEPLPDDTTVKANTTYKWRFTPDDDNYTTLTGEVELYHKSSSGGGWYDSYYTIKATAGAGGSISPSGNVSVREGGDQTFTITPDKGYAVANVKIDGKSIGAVKSYTFENVSSPHTIEAIFVKGTASASTGDSSNLPLWSALLLASTLALAGAVHLKRKRAR